MLLAYEIARWFSCRSTLTGWLCGYFAVVRHRRPLLPRPDLHLPQRLSQRSDPRRRGAALGRAGGGAIDGSFARARAIEAAQIARAGVSAAHPAGHRALPVGAVGPAVRAAAALARGSASPRRGEGLWVTLRELHQADSKVLWRDEALKESERIAN